MVANQAYDILAHWKTGHAIVVTRRNKSVAHHLAGLAKRDVLETFRQRQDLNPVLIRRALEWPVSRAGPAGTAGAAVFALAARGPRAMGSERADCRCGNDAAYGGGRVLQEVAAIHVMF